MRRNANKTDRKSKVSFVRRIAKIAILNFARGLRKLSTPVGIIALVPLVISVAAYVRSSIEISRLYLFINQPISFELSGTSVNQRNYGIRSALPESFEFFLTNSGPRTVYVRKMYFNVAPDMSGATFGNDCSYFHTLDADGSGNTIPPFEIRTQVLSQQYPYNMQSGFILSPNSVLPLSGTLASISNERHEARIGRALGAKKNEQLDMRVVMLLTEDDLSAGVVACISAAAFVAGDEAQQGIWTGASNSGTFSFRQSEDMLGAIPEAPGGEPVEAEMQKRLSVRGGELESGVLLFVHRSINLF